MSKFFDFNDAEFHDAYVEESFVAEVQYEICRLMKDKDVSRAELARRLKVSAPYVTQMLGDEDANLTLRTVAKVYKALGERASISPITQKASAAVSPKHARRRRELEWCDIQSQEHWAHDDALGRAQANECRDESDVVVWLHTYRKAA